jgi:putative drug exporter of the RND superfamily
MVRWVDAMRRASVERPRRVLLVWAVLVAGLGLLGLQVQERLSSSVMEEVPGTSSYAAERMDTAHFGSSVTVPILLTGPEHALDVQGPRLVRQLRATGEMRTLSPWDASSGAQRLAPRPGVAMISTSVQVAPGADPQAVLPRLRRTADRAVSPPVEPHISGVPAIAQALQTASMDAAHDAEKWAVPALVIVLLLVFRSLVAAAIPLVVGVATVSGGYGVLVLLSSLCDINIFASNLVAMMGLALGVDYSLLIVSRFREELQHGAVPGAAAASAAARTAGRTVAVAGIALVSAMAVALVITPSKLLLSSVVGVMVAAVLAAGSALVVLPSLLTVLGATVDRWAWGRRRQRPAPAVLARRALRRPLLATVGALALLLGLIAPALGLTTGPMDARELPEGNPVRQDFGLLQRTMGEGWGGPFEVMVVADDGRITTQQRLDALERWQQRVASWPGVDTVVGPGAVADTAARLRQAEARIDQAQHRLLDSGDGIQRLHRGLGRAAEGTQRLGAGLARASDALQQMQQRVTGSADLGDVLGRGVSGAERLADGLQRAVGGARRLSDGAQQAQDGAERLDDGLSGLASGARRLRHGGAEAQDGARTLADRLRSGARRLEQLKDPAETAERQVSHAQRALRNMTVGKGDPQYAKALRSVLRAHAALSGEDPVTGQQLDPRYPGLPESLDRAAAGVRRAAAGADRLADGLAHLRSGLAQLATGAEQLQHGTQRLAHGAGRLAHGNAALARELAQAQHGAERMAAGLARMQAGAASAQAKIDRLGSALGRVGGGIEHAAARTGQLSAGLRRGEEATAQFSGTGLTRGAHAIERFRDRSPRFFDSGYYVLATLQGAQPAQRDRANFAVDVDSGGEAGRILVVPDGAPQDPQTDALAERLQHHADDLADAADVRAAVGGQAGLVHDFSQSAYDSFFWLLAGLSLVSYLVLVPVFRALLLPALSVLLNLATVGAALGLLELLFSGSDPPLGGPGYINVLAMNAIVTVIFALSIDYQVFLVTRMREGYVLTGDGLEAIRHGIDHTARIITGAAVIMAAVFIAFAFSDVTTTQVFGVGLATATILDATVVRLVLLPGLMRLCGRRWTWWMPRWLDRLLPELDLEGTGHDTAHQARPVPVGAS